MSSSKNRWSNSKWFHEVSEELGQLGFLMEPYVVGPPGRGLGCFRLAVSTDVFAYVHFSYFGRYQQMGIYIGFSFPESKAIVDDCLLTVGRKIGIVPKYALANLCPAVLFPLEFFDESPDGQPFKVSSPLAPRVRAVVYEKILKGSHAWINSRLNLCKFLVSNEDPFLWTVSDPRRIVQCGYLLWSHGVAYEVAGNLLAPASSCAQGDGDFDAYTGNLVDEVLRYFYANYSSHCLVDE